ncbi:MAG: very short patch repair endonuclease [bacterium]
MAARRTLVSDPERRQLMRRVRQRGTPAELAVAKLCRELGLAYRCNVRSLPGSPDLANKKGRWAIFVHGCFWHQHEGCPKATMPKRNAKFWREKFVGNRARDARKIAQLCSLGYQVLVVWQCQAEDRQALRRRLQSWANRVA